MIQDVSPLIRNITSRIILKQNHRWVEIYRGHGSSHLPQNRNLLLFHFIGDGYIEVVANLIRSSWTDLRRVLGRSGDGRDDLKLEPFPRVGELVAGDGDVDVVGGVGAKNIHLIFGNESFH